MRRYVICGLSNRGVAHFARPLVGAVDGEDYAAHARLVAIVDPDEQRVAEFASTLPEDHGHMAWYPPAQFDRTVAEIGPDTVIVAGPDHTHVDYILAALRHNTDVIVEKPMVTTAADAELVLKAEAKSAATLCVTHNFRYTQRHRQIKKMIRAGLIGRPVQVTFDYHVDIRHGASYFLRWNRRRDLSGGLSVHKSTHHLDLVSWWLDDTPTQVYALGGLTYYGPHSPHRPRNADGTPVTDSQAVRERDPYFRAQLGSDTFHSDAATHRKGMFGLGYRYQYPAGRDMYLYDNEIDIEDTFSALISYRKGATLTYSIGFSSPFEGDRLMINGTHGQIEAWTTRTPDGELQAGSEMIIHRPLFGESQTFEMPVAVGGHDGADPLLRHDLFVGPTHESAELGLMADSTEGARAVAAGEGIWRSISERRAILLKELPTTDTQS